ncbi:SpoVR family protein [Paenibacillus antri]|uniref:SpoVR family protein n=1 Tax=Paenibacillus antri TaxID=2582848 RepID=A0A5R9G9Q7_9BACL|nr:SpoVR family protein [Paenibacillus antri]TLS51096.1 SpoVR family protein [Paenibacillus antri]
MLAEEQKQLEAAIEEITDIARNFGLDFYPMRYEICPADIIYTFGAYGMPTRFSHWSFGKSFHRMKTHYDLGLSKIYELVINSNPCYAFLLDGNSLIQNKLIVAHVLGHCDFFKNNVRFSRTNRDMVESMAATAERIRGYEIEYGTEAVERFLDAVLGIQEHIDPSLTRQARPGEARKGDGKPQVEAPDPYGDLWELDEEARAAAAAEAEPEKTRFPVEPEKDILWFIEQYARGMPAWQRDILTVMREEMLYFWPQIETKIMNEGWASYWHTRILRELDLTPEETIEYSKLNSSVVVPSRHQLNPYYLGYKIFEDIEKRFGRDYMFEVRELNSDQSFLRNYLTKELVEDLDLYVFEKRGQEWLITDKTWERVRDQLVASRVNGGFPVIRVLDGDYIQNGELYLKHEYDGVELDIKYMERTLPYVNQLWGRTVHLETIVEDKKIVFTYDGKKHHRRFI